MKKMRNVLILLLIVTTALTGCGKKVAVEKNVSDEKVEVNRIVTTYKPATGIVLALGGADNLVGVQDGGLKDKTLNQLIDNISENVAQVGSKKQGVNIETIISLEPDLVVMYPVKDDDMTVKRLEEQGIKVVSISPESIEDLEKDIINVGKAMNEEDKANELVSYYDEKIEMIKKNIPEEGSRKTIYLAGARGVLSTSSGTFFQHHMMEAAGGIDVASELKGGWNEISVEQLMNWNPDVIASVKYCPDGKPEEIYANDKLSNLDAVKDKEVYQMPSNIGPWDMPEPKSILGIMWMSKALYPEAFESVDLEEEANYFHENFYGVSYEQLGGVLDVRGNNQE